MKREGNLNKKKKFDLYEKTINEDINKIVS